LPLFFNSSLFLFLILPCRLTTLLGIEDLLQLFKDYSLQEKNLNIYSCCLLLFCGIKRLSCPLLYSIAFCTASAAFDSAALSAVSDLICTCETVLWTAQLTLYVCLGISPVPSELGAIRCHCQWYTEIRRETRRRAKRHKGQIFVFH